MIARRVPDNRRPDALRCCYARRFDPYNPSLLIRGAAEDDDYPTSVGNIEARGAVGFREDSAMAKLFVTALMTIAGAGCGTQATTTQTLAATGLDSGEARYCEVTTRSYDCSDTPQDLRLSCTDLLDLLDLRCASQARTGTAREECVEAEIDFVEMQTSPFCSFLDE